VFNIVSGASDTGKLLVSHDDVDMIDFTGSVAVGKAIAAESAKRLRKVNLELGGNDAAVVDSEVDPELVANGLTWGAFCNAGQVCVGVKRAFMVKSGAATLVPKIVDVTQRLRPGIDYGPIISAQQLETVEGFVKDAVKKGGKVLVGGKRGSTT